MLNFYERYDLEFEDFLLSPVDYLKRMAKDSPLPPGFDMVKKGAERFEWF